VLKFGEYTGGVEQSGRKAGCGVHRCKVLITVCVTSEAYEEENLANAKDRKAQDYDAHRCGVSDIVNPDVDDRWAFPRGPNAPAFLKEFPDRVISHARKPHRDPFLHWSR
jgi:hypothetical protein